MFVSYSALFLLECYLSLILLINDYYACLTIGNNRQASTYLYIIMYLNICFFLYLSVYTYVFIMQWRCVYNIDTALKSDTMYICFVVRM